MVIQCPECQARFKMADEKAKDGVKVRCSRCQHVFPVQLSTPDPESAPVLSQTPPAAATEAPDSFANASTTVLNTAGSAEAESFSFDNAQGADTTSTDMAIDDFDMSDYSVDTDFPATASSGSSDELELEMPNMDAESSFATANSAEDDFFLDEETPDTEFDFEQGEEKISFDSPTTEDFSFAAGAADDFSFDEEPSEAFSNVSISEPTAENNNENFSSAEEDAFSFGDLSPDSAFSIDPPTPAENDSAGSESSWSSGEGPSGDFDFTSDEPANGGESFDFSNLSFGDDDSPAPTVPLSPAVSEILPPLPSAPAPPRQERFVASDSEEDDLLMPPPQQRKSSGFSPLLGGFIVILLLLSGAAGYFFWQGGIPEISTLLASISGKAPASVSVGQIRLTDLNGYFLDNVEAGQLFVIQGKAINEYAETRSAIAVKGILYDQSGQQIMQQTVFPGNMLDDKVLRTQPFSKFAESMNNQFGDSLSNLNIAPGKTIPFSIVFRNLPTGLAEFTVEVTDSKAGSG